jgi:hypothetical protein
MKYIIQFQYPSSFNSYDFQCTFTNLYVQQSPLVLRTHSKKIKFFILGNHSTKLPPPQFLFEVSI